MSHANGAEERGMAATQIRVYVSVLSLSILENFRGTQPPTRDRRVARAQSYVACANHRGAFHTLSSRFNINLNSFRVCAAEFGMVLLTLVLLTKDGTTFVTLTY